MPMATILVVFLMVGAWALVSASQQWSARRDAYGVAASAARAGAQADPAQLRRGSVLDTAEATASAQSIIEASGYTGSVDVTGDTVRVQITATVGYRFPSPGFPASVTGSATAIAQSGVSGTEGG